MIRVSYSKVLAFNSRNGGSCADLSQVLEGDTALSQRSELFQ